MKIFIVKLAAIGDVVMACRSLTDFAQTAPEAEFFWVIDKKLERFAKSLLSTLGLKNKISFSTVDSEQLFTRGFFAKAIQSMRILSSAILFRPDALVVLHRDSRYRKLLRFRFRGEYFSTEGHSGHELEGQNALFSTLRKKFGLKNLAVPIVASATKPESGRVGFLVGGAKNQKLTYREKRWPHFQSLALEFLKNTNKTLILYGSPDDASEAAEIINTIPEKDRARVHNQVGTFTIEELPGEFENLDTFVSVDTGPAHLAAAVMRAPHQKVIVLFGPTNPKTWAPKPSGRAEVKILYKNLPCSPCYKDDGRFHPCRLEENQFQACMTSLSSSEVLANV